MMKTIPFAICFALTCLASAQDAIDDSELSTAADLLRGFSNEELVAAQRAIPTRREPPLGLARPRMIKATGHVYEDSNANG